MTTTVKIMPDRVSPPHGPLVAVLAYDGLCTFEFGVAYEVFGLPRPEMGPGWYRYQVVGVEDGPLRAAGGLTVTADGGLGHLEAADIIVVPGWRAIDAGVPEPLIQALQAANRRGARVMSLCSGITVLAQAGLLSGLKATTHWRYADSIAARFPDIALDPSVLYVDNGTVLTAAGSAAGIDLCLHVVRRDFGTEAANSVARRLVVPPHREGGQAQFIPGPVARDHEKERLSPLFDWMRKNIANDLPLTMLAERAGMSLRSFQRRFEEATGVSPGEWIAMTRLREAQRLLETEARSDLEEVARLAGYGSAANLRHHFRTRLGVSPAAYRRQFG
ncbi:transcriptional regulator FtrA [Rhizobium sp. C4]|uniref:transcriptional regulator FtrA n=1 Tax=Rhizobium sp. C4 TaxID=1349800 RepID=UPI001E47E429|nr:transcriptional regulator FtrA [Rhizobium sp. C4]MCD2171975.1 transcriptional regulator FtrA [Rhizobium sp. C4]